MHLPPPPKKSFLGVSKFICDLFKNFLTCQIYSLEFCIVSKIFISKKNYITGLINTIFKIFLKNIMMNLNFYMRHCYLINLVWLQFVHISKYCWSIHNKIFKIKELKRTNEKFFSIQLFNFVKIDNTKIIFDSWIYLSSSHFE